MALSNQFSFLQPACQALEAGVQAILIAICIIIVVAALAFAGYIPMRNNKERQLQVQLGPVLAPKENLTMTKKPDSGPVEGNAEGRTTAATAESATIALKISKMWIEPLTAKPGEMVTIWFSATNLDSSQSSHQVTLKINDQIFNVRQISILPNTLMHLNFKVLLTDPGTYTVDINGATAGFKII